MLLFAGAALVEALNGGRAPLAVFGIIIDPAAPLSAAPALVKAGIVLFAANGLGVFSGFNTRKDGERARRGVCGFAAFGLWVGTFHDRCAEIDALHCQRTKRRATHQTTRRPFTAADTY